MAKTRIVLNEEASQMFKSLKSKHKERRITGSRWEAIISEAILGISERKWEEMVDEHTSEEFFIRKALESPEEREKVLSLIKKFNRSTKYKKGKAQDGPAT